MSTNVHKARDGAELRMSRGCGPGCPVPLGYRWGWRSAFMVLLTGGALTGCHSEEKGATLSIVAQGSELQRRLGSLQLKDRLGRENLAEALRRETYAPLEELASYWRSRSGNEGDVALLVLQALGPAAYAPLVVTLDSASSEDKLFVLEDLIDKHAEQRRELAAKVDALLDDKSPVVLLQRGGVEETPLARRVCDEGYWLLRRLLHTTEREEDGAQEMWHFLRRDEDDRDAAIVKARASGEWQSFIGRRGRSAEERRLPEPSRGEAPAHELGR